MAKTSPKTLYHLAITCTSHCTQIHMKQGMVSSLTTRLEPSLNSPRAMQIHSTVPMVQHASPLSWSVTDIKNAATAAMNIPETVEIGLVPPKGSHAPPAIRNAYHPSKSVTTIEIAPTEAMSPMKFVEHQMRDAAVRDQLYKICLPGKSILSRAGNQ